MEILSQLANPTALPPGLREEIRALEREPDRELAEEGLLNLSHRAERRGDIETAAALYRVLAGNAGPTTAERARQRFQAMAGGGPGALRWEFFANRFTEQLFDPASLVGMGVAGLAFRGARLWTLGRLAQSKIISLPLTSSLLATGIGLGVETTAFVLSSGLTQVALGQRRSWSFGEYSGEWASTAILLGSMRGLGGAVPLLLRSRLGTSPSSLAWRSQIGIGLTQHAAMFGGILGSRFLESQIGLREPDESVGAALSESLATLIHFNAAGRMAHAVFGPRWAAFERDLDMRSVELRDIHGRWLRPDHLRSILLSPMWFAMGAGGMGSGFGGPPRQIPIFELLQNACSDNPGLSQSALQGLRQRFPNLDATEQSQILGALLRRSNTYNGALRERLSLGLAQMRPSIKEGVPEGLQNSVENLIGRSERSREFQRLLGLGFGPHLVPPLDMRRQIQVAPRVLDYFDDQVTHPDAHAVALHFLLHLLRMPEDIQRDVAVEIIHRGLGHSTLHRFYQSIRSPQNHLALVEAWNEELEASQAERRWEATQQLTHLALGVGGEVRSTAVRSITRMLEDTDSQIRQGSLERLQVMEKVFSLPHSRREYLQGFNVYLRRAIRNMKRGAANPQQLDQLNLLPVSVRHRLALQVLLLPNINREAQAFLDGCTDDSNFVDFALEARYESIREIRLEDE